MGYYTYHNLAVRHLDGSNFTQEHLEQITAALKEQQVLHYALEDGRIIQWKNEPQELYFGGV